VVFSVPGEVSVERKEMAVKARGQATWETGGRGDWTVSQCGRRSKQNVPLARAGIAILCDVAALWFLHSTEMGCDGMRPTAARSGLATWLTPSRLSLLAIAH
jgi:hypothetical protein